MPFWCTKRKTNSLSTRPKQVWTRTPSIAIQLFQSRIRTAPPGKWSTAVRSCNKLSKLCLPFYRWNLAGLRRMSLVNSSKSSLTLSSRKKIWGVGLCTSSSRNTSCVMTTALSLSRCQSAAKSHSCSAPTKSSASSATKWRKRSNCSALRLRIKIDMRATKEQVQQEGTSTQALTVIRTLIGDLLSTMVKAVHTRSSHQMCQVTNWSKITANREYKHSQTTIRCLASTLSSQLASLKTEEMTRFLSAQA